MVFCDNILSYFPTKKAMCECLRSESFVIRHDHSEIEMVRRTGNQEQTSAKSRYHYWSGENVLPTNECQGSDISSSFIQESAFAVLDVITGYQIVCTLTRPLYGGSRSHLATFFSLLGKAFVNGGEWSYSVSALPTFGNQAFNAFFNAEDSNRGSPYRCVLSS
ncbi:unnamed protein product [Albugo candida]|uniref:Uncharacterized protein n=1 Tax=Albugo candida TaxID=65357 RepID=A0A024GI47_9STRA|nr:unnamed protein product [Albugo candida]|eukprot:CCI46415.1 unnamed protein product [Albugo candida]